MKVGSHLKIENFGDNIQGVELFGNKNKPEPASFIVKFPSGEIEVSRCENGQYWVHIALNKDFETEKFKSRFVKARLDMTDKATSQAELGDFKNPNLYHLAVLTEKI